MTLPIPPQSRASALLSLVILVPIPTVAVLMAMVVFPGRAGQAIFFLLAIIGALLPALWHRFVDRQPWSLSPARRGGFGVAVVSGLAISTIIVGAYLLWGEALIDRDIIQAAARKNGIVDVAVFGVGWDIIMG